MHPSVPQPQALDVSALGLNSAFNDEIALINWLAVSSSRNQRTHRSYEGEARKFRRFLELLHPERAMPPYRDFLLRDAVEKDVLLYEQALRLNTAVLPPGLFAIEIGEGTRTRRPFTRALRQSSIDQALRILHAMYESFVKVNPTTRAAYVALNPVSRLIKTSSRNPVQIDRIVPQEVIKAMSDTIRRSIAYHEGLRDTIALARAYRLRWIFTLLFGLWARRAEICTLRMNDFKPSHDGWVVSLKRKGKKEPVEMAVGNWIISGLKDYRTSLGLPPIPSPDDTSFAIAPLAHRGKRDKGQQISTETIYQAVHALAAETAKNIAHGLMLTDISEERRDFILQKLKSFSPHWFRHTGATLAIEGEDMSLAAASKMLDHSSTAMTAGMYYHPDRETHRVGVDRMASRLL